MSGLSLFSRRILLSEMNQKILEDEYVCGSQDVIHGLLKDEGEFKWLYVVRTNHPAKFLLSQKEFCWEIFTAIYENINGISVLSKDLCSENEWKNLNYAMMKGIANLELDDRTAKCWRDFQYLKSEQRSFNFYERMEQIHQFHNPSIPKQEYSFPNYLLDKMEEPPVFSNIYQPFIPSCCIVDPMPLDYCFKNIYLNSLGTNLNLDFQEIQEKLITFTEDEQKENLVTGNTPNRINHINKIQKYEMPNLSPIKTAKTKSCSNFYQNGKKLF